MPVVGTIPTEVHDPSTYRNTFTAPVDELYPGVPTTIEFPSAHMPTAHPKWAYPENPVVGITPRDAHVPFTYRNTFAFPVPPIEPTMIEFPSALVATEYPKFAPAARPVVGTIPSEVHEPLTYRNTFAVPIVPPGAPATIKFPSALIAVAYPKFAPVARPVVGTTPSEVHDPFT
jgi:hypothetical protein